MPELPEVRTLINNLKKNHVIGQKIIDVNYIDSKVLKNSNKTTFSKFVINETIKDIDQIGKLIVITLSNDKYLTIHLRMEGKLFFVDAKNKPTQFTMIEFICGRKKLIYEDFRKFGTFYIYKDKHSFEESDEVKKLGLQPWDKKLTADYLLDKFKNKSIAIKTILLDQSIIAGIGNIYSDEICFACKINPKRPAKLVSKKECEDIIKSCRKIMTRAINHYGTTVFTYKFAPNHSGSFQNYLMVYSREGQKCKVCGSTIKKIKLNGRGTTYCPKCQPK